MKPYLYAICILKEDGNSGVSGIVHFIQNEGGKTRIRAKISGLSKGKHGLHIHEFGNLTEGCKSAGAHFNPIGKSHGGPQDVERHVGDMGNIDSNGIDESILDYEDNLISLIGLHSIVGRSVVCHADEDDLGKGNFEDSKTTGHAGARVACGTIGWSNKF